MASKIYTDYSKIRNSADARLLPGGATLHRSNNLYKPNLTPEHNAMKTKATFFTAINLMTALCFATVQTTQAQCRDPWINQIYREVAGRGPVGTGEVGECSIKLYNNGSWNNYNELKRYVQELRNNAVRIAYKDVGNDKFVMAVSQNGNMGVNLMTRAGSVVAGGAGNVVAGGAGNLIGMDGAGIISNDGASIRIDKNTPGFSFSGGYSALSGRKIKTSGNAGIKIQ